jgi:hypothetical protein
MSDKIGVLGEATATTVATTTVYTCPAGKAAKVRLMFRAQGDATTAIAILVNGLEVARVAAMTANFYVCSIKGAGLRIAEQAAAPTGIGAGLTVAPADQIYYLSAGDTVQYTIITAAALAMNFQVVGTEIDV